MLNELPLISCWLLDSIEKFDIHVHVSVLETQTVYFLVLDLFLIEAHVLLSLLTTVTCLLPCVCLMSRGKLTTPLEVIPANSFCKLLGRKKGYI